MIAARSLVVLAAMAAGCAASQKRAALSAVEHEELAAAATGPTGGEHRAAAEQIRAEQLSACSGIDGFAVDLEPLISPEEVERVGWLMGLGQRGAKRVRGAVIVLRRVPGLDAEVVRRRITCHLARAAVLGWFRPEAARCPLCVRGASASAKVEDGELRIEVRGGDAAGVDEIWRRARLLEHPGEVDRPSGPPPGDGGQQEAPAGQGPRGGPWDASRPAVAGLERALQATDFATRTSGITGLAHRWQLPERRNQRNLPTVPA